MSGVIQALHEESWDSEWVSLMLTARKIGITLDEVRIFLEQSSAQSFGKEKNT